MTPYLFLGPFLILFTVFVLAPILVLAWSSTRQWILGFDSGGFVGWANYASLLSGEGVLSEEFWRGMRVTAIFTVLSVPLLVTIPFALALLLNLRFRGRTVFRALYFAPYVLGVAVVGVLWHFLLDAQVGPVNHLLGALGLPDSIAWTTSLPAAWVSLVGVTVWWTVGFNAVIYLAALQEVPAELYEAARVDGAGAWRRLWTVTIPHMHRVLQFVVVITIIASANMYGQSALITNEQPGGATRTAIGYIAQTGMQSYDIGMASAMSMALALCLILASLLVNQLFRFVGKV
ncbi:carbohydrate ABC transporter permease [Brachybacterium sp. YJGR34]|uniref:carbohydrate ABC transporter permease n=1 Tax=Brachybacterium sp. YJGR34 TaxID=2059911 RepID=UPI001E43BA69|nr:sugar ABC transporter permease [Brachybacterium sp. YJGR34]